MWFFNKNYIRGAERSPKWKEVRKLHLQKQPACMVCNSTKNLEVHHIVPVHVDAERELDETNLITLCDKYCHFVFGHLMNWKSWNVEIFRDCDVFNKKIRHRP